MSLFVFFIGCKLDMIVVHLTGIVHHLDAVPITALIAGLGHQSLEPAADFPERFLGLIPNIIDTSQTDKSPTNPERTI